MIAAPQFVGWVGHLIHNLTSGGKLTVQIARVDALPAKGARAIHRQLVELPLPPELDARMEFDGYRILRPVHVSHLSHAWLAVDN